jgi:glycosyltransferase involved in cell wall biosynthesis
VSSQDSPVLFLTNYRGGGIGDFSADLGRHLASRIRDLRIEETSIEGKGSFRQAIIAATYPGNVVASLGLTAWGISPIRNFSGFSSLGIHSSLGRTTVAVVHHAIEILDPMETGYDINNLVKKGAHAALQQISRCDIVVFSPRLRDVLQRKYGSRSVLLVPLPGNRCLNPPGRPDGSRPRVVCAGYWAPYKGIDLYLGVADRLSAAADFVLVGQPHALLSRNPNFKAEVEKWKARARRLNVALPGFLRSNELDMTLSGYCIGVLPYTSVSGASASFQLFAERGIPVVASNLPEFRYLSECGAGVLLVESTIDGLSGGIEKLLVDQDLWFRLAQKQAIFSDHYCWDWFTQELVARYKLRSDTVSQDSR